MRQKTRNLSTKVRRTCVPLSRKSISNRVRSRVEGVNIVYPYAESVSKTNTLRQKVSFEASKTKSASRTRTLWQKSPLRSSFSMELSRPQGHPQVRVKRRFCQITRVFSCILRHVGSDLEAEREGSVSFNLSYSSESVSKMRPLRQKVDARVG